jgi:hypothetical protein
VPGHDFAKRPLTAAQRILPEEFPVRDYRSHPPIVYANGLGGQEIPML